MTEFTAANARARGLATQLLARAELETWTGHDLNAFAHWVARTRKIPTPMPVTPTAGELERVFRRHAATLRARLARWGGAGPPLEIFYAEQDRRSIRAMLRGAVQVAPLQKRLAGLIPTPLLPERVLEELARQPLPLAVVNHLFELQHPYASRLLPLTARKTQPGLMELEMALTKGFSQLATHAARAGDSNLIQYVHQCLDIANAAGALVLRGAVDVEADTCFVDGGSALKRPDWLAMVKAPDTLTARALLHRAWVDTPLQALSDDVALDPGRLERAGFSLALTQQRERSLLDPLSSAPVLLFLLRLEAQSRDLQRLTWAAASDAPASIVKKDLVTPWN